MVEWVLARRLGWRATETDGACRSGLLQRVLGGVSQWLLYPQLRCLLRRPGTRWSRASNCSPGKVASTTAYDNQDLGRARDAFYLFPASSSHAEQRKAAEDAVEESGKGRFSRLSGPTMNDC